MFRVVAKSENVRPTVHALRQSPKKKRICPADRLVLSPCHLPPTGILDKDLVQQCTKEARFERRSIRYQIQILALFVLVPAPAAHRRMPKIPSNTE